MDKIKISNILKIRRHKYFQEVSHKYVEINKFMQKKIKYTMIHAMMHNSVEVLTIIDNSTFRAVTCTNNSYTTVTMPSDIMNRLKIENDSDTTFTVIHNHPNPCGFSILDLHTFIENDRENS